MPNSKSTVEEIYEKADKTLYKAKEIGRNKIVKVST
jgi:PleD family two-component response regulator